MNGWQIAAAVTGAAVVGGGIVFGVQAWRRRQASAPSSLPPVQVTPSPPPRMVVDADGRILPTPALPPPSQVSPALPAPPAGASEVYDPTASPFARAMPPTSPGGGGPSAYGVTPLGGTPSSRPPTDLFTKDGQPLYQRGNSLYTADNRWVETSPSSPVVMVVESTRKLADGRTIGTRDTFEVYLKDGRRYHRNGIPVIMQMTTAEPLAYNPLATFKPPSSLISGFGRRDGGDQFWSGGTRR